MVKEVDGTNITNPNRASCHCGAVVLELELPKGIENPRRCDCSICRRKGAIVAAVPLSSLKIVEGTEVLREYQVNTKVARHFFARSVEYTRIISDDLVRRNMGSMLVAWRVLARSKSPMSKSTMASTILLMPPKQHNKSLKYVPALSGIHRTRLANRHVLES